MGEGATPLYLSDKELAHLVGVPERDWKAITATLEKKGFPPQDPLFNGKRYAPAVRAYLDRRNGLGSQSASLKPDGKENFDEYLSHARRARPEKAVA